MCFHRLSSTRNIPLNYKCFLVLGWKHCTPKVKSMLSVLMTLLFKWPEWKCVSGSEVKLVIIRCCTHNCQSCLARSLRGSTEHPFLGKTISSQLTASKSRMLSLGSLCRPHGSTFQCYEQTAEQSFQAASLLRPAPLPLWRLTELQHFHNAFKTCVDSLSELSFLSFLSSFFLFFSSLFQEQLAGFQGFLGGNLN